LGLGLGSEKRSRPNTIVDDKGRPITRLPNGTLVDANGNQLSQKPDGTFVGSDGKPVAVMLAPGARGLVDDKGRPITRLPNCTLVDANGYQLSQMPTGRFVGPHGKAVSVEQGSRASGIVDDKGRPISRLPNGTLVDVNGSKLSQKPDGIFVGSGG